ncbi:hypothetical protein KYK30_17220 [Shinella yambaruensis]|uniref:Uncharacterized protein n=1 Tax=Shinella yambaruensis TaxID=415996 RepID=A0ABQ5ZL26_9HYPH|nr:hypothetical protein [Shinella yambaruensis]MCJ8028382.1 hypothetical protein [Shinella yambaruensis]MCU7981435.1 hypothetical protein [Shinella yambaruensis]GLR53534.1 hypothetical protein GCM10007923_47490 [Shinella yambaruensis]
MKLHNTGAVDDRLHDGRIVGLGLHAMALVIELTVPDGWPIHIIWTAMALAVMRWRPGYLSLD